MKTNKVLFFGLIISIVLVFAFGVYCWNENKSFITPDPLPLEPTNVLPILSRFIPDPDYDGDVIVEWIGVRNATSYNIYRNVNGSEFVVIEEQRREFVLIYRYNDRGLSNGKYGYKITAMIRDETSLTLIESDFSNIEFVNVII